jgi:hypothetical protein
MVLSSPKHGMSFPHSVSLLPSVHHPKHVGYSKLLRVSQKYEIYCKMAAIVNLHNPITEESNNDKVR